MSPSILFSDTPEHFYHQLRECIQQTIKQELSAIKKEDSEVYLKKHEVCKMLRVSKPTVDSHVSQGYYKKHYIGSRVFFSKANEIAIFEGFLASFLIKLFIKKVLLP